MKERNEVILPLPTCHQQLQYTNKSTRLWTIWSHSIYSGFEPNALRRLKHYSLTTLSHLKTFTYDLGGMLRNYC